MRAAGYTGQLRYRYQVAALLGSWSLEPVIGTSGHRFRLCATVVRCIEPWASYRPLDVHLMFGSAVWFWTHVDLDPIVGVGLDLGELHEEPTIIQRSHYVEPLVR
jgi:hypothetical protein